MARHYAGTSLRAADIDACRLGRRLLASRPGRLPEQLSARAAAELLALEMAAASRRPAAIRTARRLAHTRHEGRRRGDRGADRTAAAYLDRARGIPRPGGRPQHPHRPAVLAARLAAVLRRPDARGAVAAGDRGPAAHRRGAHLPQPLRPSRPARGEGARRLAPWLAALPRAAGAEG